MNIPLLFPEWNAPSHVFAGMTTRQGGHSVAPYGLVNGRAGGLNLGDHVGDDPTVVARNRAALALPASPIWMRQVHGCDVVDLDTLAPNAQTPIADAAITSGVDWACVVLVADCMPVLLTDAKGLVV
ncbi:MAG TPA: laccase domain-containing protein, partial [Burkholderiaceae bacterium]|nr:laccase domain-containing protein [Burkholderiaceae bacterium]